MFGPPGIEHQGLKPSFLCSTAGTRLMAGMAVAAQPGIRRHNAVRLTLQNYGVGGSSDKVGPPVGQGAGDAAVRGATVPAPTGGGTNTAARGE